MKCKLNKKELSILTAALQETTSLLTGESPIFTTNFNEAIDNLAQALSNKKLIEMQSVREALLALDWKQIKKHAKIIYNVDSLGVDEKLYSCVKANAVVACLSDVKQYKYKIALQKAFDPQTEKRQMLRVTVHDAAAIATLLSSLMPKETLGYISQLLQYLAK